MKVAVASPLPLNSSEVLFASGRADLTAEGQNEISKIKSLIFL